MNDTATGAGETIRVTLKVFGGLREALGTPERSIRLSRAASLDTLLERLRIDEPAFAQRLDEGLAKGYLNILRNGRNVRFLDGLETQLSEGDVIACLPPVGGG